MWCSTSARAKQNAPLMPQQLDPRLMPASRRQSLRICQYGIELVEIDGLYEMAVEADFGRAFAILIAPPSCQRDEHRGCGARISPQPLSYFIPTQIGQSDVE